MATLHILMGCAGSGKSTWIQNHLNEYTEWISRDHIRFSLVNEDEEYFSKEKEVFKEFVRRIDETLKNGKDVFADATHLNKTSRLKLMNAVDFSLVTNVNIIWIKTPLDECLARNANRAGTRSYVPESAIRRMFYNIEKPDLEERFDTIYIVEDNKPIQMIRKMEEYDGEEMVCL